MRLFGSIIVASVFFGCSSSYSPSTGGGADQGDNSPVPSSSSESKKDDPATSPDPSTSPGAVVPPTTSTTGGPFVATPNQWTWMPMADVVCADGSTSGVGVNLAPASSHVVIFLQGGGACWDATTCTVGTATNLDGYRAEDFASEEDLDETPILRRDLATNPLRDANYVYVPYCTGDVFSGDTVNTYEGVVDDTVIHHVGYTDLTAILARVSATFPKADRVWLVGESSGGFGALWNFDHVQKALPQTRVDLIDDSGPPLDFPAERYLTWVSTWKMQFPKDCTDCASHSQAILDYNVHTYPDHRFALLSYTNDGVISEFGDLSLSEFNGQLNALTTRFDASTDLRYFIAEGDGTDHVIMGASSPTTHGVSHLDFLSAMVDDKAVWASVK